MEVWNVTPDIGRRYSPQAKARKRRFTPHQEQYSKCQCGNWRGRDGRLMELPKTVEEVNDDGCVKRFLLLSRLSRPAIHISCARWRNNLTLRIEALTWRENGVYFDVNLSVQPKKWLPFSPSGFYVLDRLVCLDRQYWRSWKDLSY